MGAGADLRGKADGEHRAGGGQGLPGLCHPGTAGSRLPDLLPHPRRGGAGDSGGRKPEPGGGSGDHVQDPALGSRPASGSGRLYRGLLQEGVTPCL